MLPSLVLASSLFVWSGSVAAYSTNYTSQLLSSGTVSLGEWEAAYEKAQAFADSLNTTEKIAVITGSSVSSVNFTALNYLDSGNSLLSYYYVTTFPVGQAVAQTWDKELVFSQYNALAAEFYGKGIQVANAPLSEPIGRTPWGGRNAEAFGPDAYLNGIVFGLACKGFTEAGVVPAGKHFLLNEQETNRESMDDSSPSYSSDADDKTLHETYLWPFYDAVKNGMGGVMCAMNRVNETYSCENQPLLAGFLKTELGFPGLVYGDVSGQKTAFGSANAGMDLGDASTWSTDIMTAGINNGSLTEARLNDMVVRNVITSYKLNQDNGSYPELAGKADYVDVRGNHRVVAYDVAAASLVLLKNTNGTLPLSKPKSMAIFGVHAGPPTGGPNIQFSVQGVADVYQGHLAQVEGSGQGSFAYLITPLHALTEQIVKDGTQFRYFLNDTDSSSATNSGTDATGATISTHLYTGTSGAVTIDNYSSDNEVCIVFLNAYSGEGADRGQLRDTDQDDLVTTVAGNCNNTIVVINTTGPRLVDAWIENENVTAVVYGSVLGQESGNAIVDVLYGRVNPSGKLVYTIAKNESDYNVEICETTVCTYDEGNYIDYKYFDKYNVTPRYEFGYGLSYTTFEYATNLTVAKTNSTALSSTYPTGTHSVGGKDDLWETVATVSTTITNTGDVDGAEVAQLYVAYPTSADEPVTQLRGFAKVNITAGASEKATFELRRRDLSIWDVVAQEWAIVSGTYTFYVGASSRDFKAQATMTI